MREIVFDLSDDGYLPKSGFGGFEGEHNATGLTLCMPERLLAPDAIYYMVFETEKNGEVLFSAPLLPDKNAIYTMLPKQVMLAPRITVHAAAYRKNGEELVEIAKSARAVLEIKYPEGAIRSELSQDGGGIPGLVIESAVLPESENPVSSRALYGELSTLVGEQVQSAFVNDAGELILKKKNRKELCAGGVVGPQGEQGPKGETGPQGEQGPQGEKGESATYYKYDFNGDGFVDEEDAAYLLYHINNRNESDYKLSWWSVPDVNGDGDVDLNDTIALQYMLNNGDPSAFDTVPKTEIIDGEFSVTSEKPIQNKAVSQGVANALKGTASGSAVALKDVSPIEHKIGVKLSSDTVTDFSTVILTEYGKNLFDWNSNLTSGTIEEIDGAKVFKAKDTRYLGIDITDAWTIVSVLGQKVRISFDIKADQAGQFRVYTLGLKAFSIAQQYHECGVEWTRFSVIGSLSSTSTGNDWCALSFAGQAEGVIPYVKNIQIELGETETELERFQMQTYTPKADGTVEGVTSLYPTTTLVTDTAGVTVSAEYNKDLNKAFAEIYQAIATMGAAAVTIPEEV